MATVPVFPSLGDALNVLAPGAGVLSGVPLLGERLVAAGAPRQARVVEPREVAVHVAGVHQLARDVLQRHPRADQLPEAAREVPDLAVDLLRPGVHPVHPGLGLLGDEHAAEETLQAVRTGVVRRIAPDADEVGTVPEQGRVRVRDDESVAHVVQTVGAAVPQEQDGLLPGGRRDGGEDLVTLFPGVEDGHAVDAFVEKPEHPRARIGGVYYYHVRFVYLSMCTGRRAFHDTAGRKFSSLARTLRALICMSGTGRTVSSSRLTRPCRACPWRRSPLRGAPTRTPPPSWRSTPRSPPCRRGSRRSPCTLRRRGGTRT